MEDENNIAAFAKLTMLPDVGAITAMRLLKRFGSCQAIFSASEEEISEVDRIGEKTARKIVEARDYLNPLPSLKRLERLGGRYIPFVSPKYPQILSSLPDKPVGLFVMGEVDLNMPCVAIVGSRECTKYGLDAARSFASGLARAGICVVSGLARGIDSAAHEGALEAGGSTIAVLGCGVDVIYPPENSKLYEEILSSKKGGVISEFPMGTRIDRQNFPIRNRIISGISLATVVVESDERGGSMITARLAAEQGRDVYAVPGRIDSPSSRGCHALIRDGVWLARSADDVIDDLKFSNKLNVRARVDPPARASKPTEKKISKSEGGSDKTPSVEIFGNEAKIFTLFEKGECLTVDEISEKSGLPISTCLAVLLSLRIKKILSDKPGGFWCKR